MRKKIISIAIFIVIFGLGTCFGKLLNWGYFELSKEVKIIEAISIFTTIGVAVYITKTLEKEVQVRRIEKDLFITKLSELETLLKIIEDIIDEKDASYRKINSRIHAFRLIKKSIFDSINGYCKKNSSAQFAKIEESINEHSNILKRLLTDTPIKGKGENPEIVLLGGLVNYSIYRIMEINIETNSLREDLFLLKVRINNL